MDIANSIGAGNNLAGLMQNNRLEKLQISSNNVKAQNQDKIKELSEEFESFLLYYVMKSMRNTVPKSDFFSSNAEDIFTSMMDQEIAKNAAHKDGGIGLAQIVQQQLTNRENQTLEDRGLALPKSKDNIKAGSPNNR